MHREDDRLYGKISRELPVNSKLSYAALPNGTFFDAANKILQSNLGLSPTNKLWTLRKPSDRLSGKSKLTDNASSAVLRWKDRAAHGKHGPNCIPKDIG